MRYYELMLGATSEGIQENATIRLKNYDYESVIGAVNQYMYQNLKNNIYFFVFREEEKGIHSAFAYDERNYSLDDACAIILDMIKDALRVDKIAQLPAEITMYDFCERLLEGKRRGFARNWGTIADRAKVLVYDEVVRSNEKYFPYDFEERIISEKVKKDTRMYDESLIKELSNIESHRNDSDFTGNMVHYFISCKSMEAASDMTEILMQKLAKANRLRGRRMEIVRNMVPDTGTRQNYLEDIIENNQGGVIIFDLSEKFGHNATEYGNTCAFLAKLVKQYRNDCLFVFTYNMDSPGFAYQLLPLVKKYILPVAIREGKGNRRTAVGYMKTLIRNSQYAQYAHQADEFMKNFPGNEFTQTDILQAFEQFEAWCLNKNVLKAYDYSLSDTFLLDRDREGASAYERLNEMTGLKSVKEQIERIISSDIVEKERKRRQGHSYESKCMHMIFAGKPGTAKTTVARLFAGIAKERDILKSGAFVERCGKELNGPLGDRIKEAFDAAKGGVLFIDEAYSLSGFTVPSLIQQMENRRDEVIVILAGYNDGMKNFLSLNEGLKSRIPYWVDFPDYSAGELTEIFQTMVKKQGFSVTKEGLEKAEEIFERARVAENFGNGRYVRNFLESAILNQSLRLLEEGKDLEKVKKERLFRLTAKDIVSAEDEVCMEKNMEKKEKSHSKIVDAGKELEEMIGLESVKKVIHKAVSSFKVKKLYQERGIRKDKPSMHMVFTGNPGTAKTTVARLLAKILKDEKILSTGTFVEVGRADLVGKFVGWTAGIVKQKFKEAKGGVLFIDEAYSLCDNLQGGYGDEAINTIVQEMENHREDVVVIFAGYPVQMQEFLDRNPGMASRIAFHVGFEDYSTEELCDITRLMLAKKQMSIKDAAMEKLKGIYEIARKSPDYGNGRFVRRILEEAEMNLAERVAQMDEDALTTEILTTIEEVDIPEQKPNAEDEKPRIGFRVA